jgi:hypothetical protein
MIILDEKQYAEDLLKHGFCHFMSLKDLSILAKYFYFLGNNKKEIENNLIIFCKRFNPAFNEIISGWVIKKSLSICKEYKLRIPIKINVFRNELDVISQLDNYKYEKILFVMLVCAKNEKLNKTRIKSKNNKKHTDNYYVNSNFIEILKLAKVSVSREERNKILYELNKLEFINATHSGSYKVNYIEQSSDETEILLSVLSNNNMIDVYKKWKPIETIKCSKCFITIEKKSNRHGLCKDCYKKHRKESVRKYAKDYYYKNKNLIS